MDLTFVSVVLGGAASTMSAIAINLVANDVTERAPRLAMKLIEIAAGRLGPDLRERFLEEWSADIEAKQTKLGKLLFALGLLVASVRMRPPAIELPRLQGFRGSWLAQAEFLFRLALRMSRLFLFPLTAIEWFGRVIGLWLTGGKVSDARSEIDSLFSWLENADFLPGNAANTKDDDD